MNKMNPAVKKEWVAKLRSGKYKQGKGTLRCIPYTSTDIHYCCLGVMCLVKAKMCKQSVEKVFISQKLEIGALSDATLKWAMLDKEIQKKLTDMNDISGCSFRSIASYIERYL